MIFLLQFSLKLLRCLFPTPMGCSISFCSSVIDSFIFMAYIAFVGQLKAKHILDCWRLLIVTGVFKRSPTKLFFCRTILLLPLVFSSNLGSFSNKSIYITSKIRNLFFVSDEIFLFLILMFSFSNASFPNLMCVWISMMHFPSFVKTFPRLVQSDRALHIQRMLKIISQHTGI